MPATVGSEILDEIVRVSAKRGRWEGYARVNPEMAKSLAPGQFMMQVAIDRAKAAVHGDDPAEAIAALEDLRAFDDQD